MSTPGAEWTEVVRKSKKSKETKARNRANKASETGEGPPQPQFDTDKNDTGIAAEETLESETWDNDRAVDNSANWGTGGERVKDGGQSQPESSRLIRNLLFGHFATVSQTASWQTTIRKKCLPWRRIVATVQPV